MVVTTRNVESLPCILNKCCIDTINDDVLLTEYLPEFRQLCEILTCRLNDYMTQYVIPGISDLCRHRDFEYTSTF